MLNEFIGKLESLLNQYDISEQEKQDILDDYRQIIDDGIGKELSDMTIMEMIGSPEKIVSELGLHQKHSSTTKSHGGEKLIALSPFISLIIFFVLGITKNLWHPGWMVFLLIPVTAIIVELFGKDNYVLTALSPFISFIIFMLLGSKYNLWHPGWLIFFIIPLLGIIESKKEMDNLEFVTALSPFISLIAFILIGYYTGEYKYTWLLFLLVVFLGIFHEYSSKSKLILFTTLFLSTGLYLVLTYYYSWQIGLLAFIIFVVAGIYTNTINIFINGNLNKLDLFIVFMSFTSFICVGYFLDLWEISWLLLLLIPITMILKYQKAKPILTPLSPFISLIIFMILGYFFDLWYISWLAFLLIPVTAIVENA